MDENLQGYKKIVIESMTKYVDEKLATCTAGTPLILTIVTSLLAFFFTTNYISEEIYNAIIYVVVYLLVCLVSILFACIPRAYYEEENRFFRRFWEKLKTPFNPFNINTYMKLSNNDFIKDMSNHLGLEFSKAETIQLFFLKQKINEYRSKKRWLFFAYVIIIFGTLLLIIGFGIKMFTIVEGML